MSGLLLSFVGICIAICCDLTFHAFHVQNTNLEHLYIIEVLMHAYATIIASILLSSAFKSSGVSLCPKNLQSFDLNCSFLAFNFNRSYCENVSTKE